MSLMIVNRMEPDFKPCETALEVTGSRGVDKAEAYFERELGLGIRVFVNGRLAGHIRPIFRMMRSRKRAVPRKRPEKGG